MSNTDTNMSGAKPEIPPPLPYGIPYPPSLPNRIQDPQYAHGGQIDADWQKHGRYFGVRDDPSGAGGFQIRPLNKPKGDQSLKALLKRKRNDDDDDWTVQYRLGRPSENLPWIDIVAKWGLEILDKAGFLNLALGPPESLLAPQSRYLAKRPEEWRGDAVHPVFRQDMWRDVDDAEYLNLKPAVLLASALLDDPTTMCVFYALATPECCEDFIEPNLGLCRRLKVPDSLTEEQQAFTFQKICDMRRWTCFYWEDPDVLDREGALAWTQATQGTTAASLHSKIGLFRHYSTAIQNWRDKATRSDYADFFSNILDTARTSRTHIPATFEQNFDSAPLRTIVLFAAILVHEFAHAFRMAYFPNPLDVYQAEPWIGDSRFNELGHALMLHMLSGIPIANFFKPPMGTPAQIKWQVDAYAPFGIFVMEKWQPWMPAGKGYLQKGIKKDFTSPTTHFPVPQRQLYDYFTEEMWRVKVPRFGLDALRFVKIPEWASHRMPGPNPVNPAEKSTVR